jgi:tetratricopeptide (TPR) repeat protein
MHIPLKYCSSPEELVGDMATFEERFHVGKEAYNQNDIRSAEQWFDSALAMSQNEDNATLVELLDYAAITKHNMGKSGEAIELSRRLLEIDPLHTRVRDNVEHYVSLQERNITKSPPPIDQSLGSDNKLIGPGKSFMPAYRQLCRGERLTTKQFSCRYENFNIPQLILQPIKTEQVCFDS